MGHSLRTWNAPAGLPWPWLLPSSSRRRRSCCCGHVTASSRPCRSTRDRTSRPPKSSALATTATASSCSSPPARRSRWRCSCGSCAAHPRRCAGRSGGRCSWRRAPARPCRWASPSPSSRSAPSATTARSTSGSRPRTGVRGWATWPSRRPSAPSSPAVGAAAALALMRRFPRGWWVPGSVLVVGFATASIYLGPVVLDPIFNSSRRCPRGAREPTCWRWRARRSVEVGQVYEVDASRRTTGLQRLRHRSGPDQARRPLRQPPQGLHPRRGAPRGRPRARPRALPRRAARPALRRAGGAGARSSPRRCSRDGSPRTSRGPGRRRCRRSRSRSPS